MTTPHEDAEAKVRKARPPIWIPVPYDAESKVCDAPECGATIFYAKNPRTGNINPVNCGVPGGFLPAAPNVEALPSPDGLPRYGLGISHFQDCTDPQRFSRSRARR